MSKGFETNQVINGTWGEAWLNGEYLAQVIAVKAEINIKTTPIAQVQTLTEGQKMTGLETKGEIKLHKINSAIMKKYSDEIKAGKMPKGTIMTNLKDPNSSGQERVVYYGCVFDKIILADWEAGKMLEESYSFTFEDWDIIQSI